MLGVLVLVVYVVKVLWYLDCICVCCCFRFDVCALWFGFIVTVGWLLVVVWAGLFVWFVMFVACLNLLLFVLFGCLG